MVQPPCNRDEDNIKAYNYDKFLCDFNKGHDAPIKLHQQFEIFIEVVTIESLGFI